MPKVLICVCIYSLIKFLEINTIYIFGFCNKPIEVYISSNYVSTQFISAQTIEIVSPLFYKQNMQSHQTEGRVVKKLQVVAVAVGPPLLPSSPFICIPIPNSNRGGVVVIVCTHLPKNVQNHSFPGN